VDTCMQLHIYTHWLRRGLHAHTLIYMKLIGVPQKSEPLLNRARFSLLEEVTTSGVGGDAGRSRIPSRGACAGEAEVSSRLILRASST